MGNGATGSGELVALTTGEDLGTDALKACCAAAYADPAVRWLLGDDLHPGGATTTRRLLELAHVEPGQRLLDVASGSGASALLAASEYGVEAVGLEYSHDAVRAAAETADASGLADRVSFRTGDAESIPLADSSFDRVLCECSLSTFPNQRQAVEEIRRVLRPGGRLALSDVVLTAPALPQMLGGAMGMIACLGGALSTDGYCQLLQRAGLPVEHIECVRDEVDLFVRGIEERLRGARLLGIAPPDGAPLGIETAIEVAREARNAIARRALGYSIIVAGG